MEVARRYCAERGMYGEPQLGPPNRWVEGFFYQINCTQPQPPAPSLLQPAEFNKPQEKPTPSASFEQIKSKCSELGFKAGTEQFGNCVLQLSK
jgi:hypothetical protein